MKTVVIVGHPEAEKSGTQAFLKAAAAGVGVDWHQLERPFDLASERKRLWQADRIVLEFPLYWYSVPAILKEWEDALFDRHLLGPDGDRLAGKELGVVVNTGQPLADFTAGGKQSFTLSEYLRPIEGLAKACQMKYMAPLAIGQFAYQSDDEKQALLVRYQQYLTLERPGRFSDQVAWLGERLETLASDEEDEGRASQLRQLQALLESNQEELTDLRASLDLVRREEE